MKELNARLDVDRKPIPDDEIEEMMGERDIKDIEWALAGLYYIMVEQTEGEAALRVNGVDPGRGMDTYMRVYLWFA